MGRQSLSDWVDTILNQVEPVGDYRINTIKPNNQKSLIDSGNVVLVIGFASSLNLPHMAPDNRYYIRAGAHTVPAKHFIVEALRTKRNVAEPVLRGTLQLHPNKKGVIELVVASITGVPALDVSIDFKPRMKFFEHYGNDDLPFKIPFIDDVHYFRLDIGIIGTRKDNASWFGHEEVKLILKYSNYDGKVFEHENNIDPFKSIVHSELVPSSSDDIKNSLKSLSDDMRWFKMQFGHLLPKLLDPLDNTNDDSKEDNSD